MVHTPEDIVTFFAVLPPTLEHVSLEQGAKSQKAPAQVEKKKEEVKPQPKEEKKEQPKEEKKEEKKEDDIDDLFGDDEDDEEYEKELQRRKEEAMAAKGMNDSITFHLLFSLFHVTSSFLPPLPSHHSFFFHSYIEDMKSND